MRMDVKQKERLLAILNVWQILRKANVSIDDGINSINGLFLRFTGKRKLRLHLSRKQEYVVDTDKISNIEFHAKKSFRIDMVMSMSDGSMVYIETN